MLKVNQLKVRKVGLPPLFVRGYIETTLQVALKLAAS
jgi:hypothetical protein